MTFVEKRLYLNGQLVVETLGNAHSRVGKEPRGGYAPDAKVPRVEVELVPQLATILEILCRQG